MPTERNIRMIVASGEIKQNARLGRFYRLEDRRVMTAKHIMSELIEEPVYEMTATVLPNGDVAVRGKPFKRFRHSEWD